MNRESIERDLMNVDLYKSLYGELKTLTPKESFPGQIRTRLNDLINKAGSKKGDIAAIIAAFYYFTHGKQEFEFLDNYYKDMFSWCFTPYNISNFFNEIVKNDEILTPLLEIANETVINNLYKFCKRQNRLNKRLGNDQYEAAFNKISSHYGKSSNDLFDLDIVNEFDVASLPVNDIRAKQEQLLKEQMKLDEKRLATEREQRILAAAERKKTNEMLEEAADKLNLDSKGLKSGIYKSDINPRQINSISVDQSIINKTFTSKVNTVPKNIFKKIAYRASIRKMVKGLDFVLDGDNLSISKKEKFSLRQKIASTDNEVIKSIVKSARISKQLYLSLADVGNSLVEEIKKQFSEIKDIYKEFGLGMYGYNPGMFKPENEISGQEQMDLNPDVNSDFKAINPPDDKALNLDTNINDIFAPINNEQNKKPDLIKSPEKVFQLRDGRLLKVRAVGGNKVGNIKNPLDKDKSKLERRVI